MNSPKSSPPRGTGESSRAGGPLSPARRRFAKGAAPVLLGTLASKPVLGASLYHCTVSGQVSGNLSRPGLASTCVIGASRSDWLTAVTWPLPIGNGKGTLPNDQCNFPGNSVIRGTNFNGFGPAGLPALKDAFFNVPVNLQQGNKYCDVVANPSNPTSNPATMLQVLNTDPAVATSPIFQLGRATVISLLNSYQYPNYPVTTHTIIAMFNATYLGGGYAVNASVTWSQARVIEYLTSLYKAD